MMVVVQSTLSESRTFDVDTLMEVDSESCQASTVNNVTSSSSSDTSAVVQPRRQIKLTSVLQLRSAVESDMHSGQLVAPSTVVPHSILTRDTDIGILSCPPITFQYCIA